MANDLDKIKNGLVHTRRIYGKKLVLAVANTQTTPGFVINLGEEQELEVIPEGGTNSVIITLARNEVIPIRFKTVVSATDISTVYFIY